MLGKSARSRTLAGVFIETCERKSQPVRKPVSGMFADRAIVDRSQRPPRQGGVAVDKSMV